jgi:hypothetical protein
MVLEKIYRAGGGRGVKITENIQITAKTPTVPYKNNVFSKLQDQGKTVKPSIEPVRFCTYI